jgi:hypothetical protein
MALFAIVVLATIISAATFVSQQGYRGGRNTLVEQRAFAVAEFGLNSEVSNWDRKRNLPAPTGMNVGDVQMNLVHVAAGDTARVSIKRISSNGYWVVSEGRANIGSSALESARQTSAFVRIAYPSIEPKGAITAAGNVRLQGSMEVSGYDHPPAGWNQCAQLPSDSVPAVVVPPSSTVNSGPSNITSIPAVVHDAAAADSNTYVRYGSESWNTLTSNADIVLAGGNFGSDIAPVGSPTTCDYANQLNWGEPYRVAGSIAGCYGYYPIIYSKSSLHINGNGYGQGILLVNGDLEINGKFEFFGLVIVRDDILKGNGTALIQGSVLAANLSGPSDPLSWFNGNQDVMYSRCAIESALRGSAILVRAKERHWAQIF